MSVHSTDIPSISVTSDAPPNTASKASSRPPAINVAVLQPPESTQQHTHSRSPSDPAFLVPGRPYYLESNASSNDLPPSPTLSTQSSVHFATSVALRDNKPEEGSGLTSLNLLSPSPNDSKHRRKGSSATFTSSAEGHSLDGTEPDHGSQFALRHAISNATSMTVESPTETHVDDASMMHKHRSNSKDSQVVEKRKKAGKRKNNNDDEDAADPHKQQRVELVQDEEIDPTPFAYKPYELASMLDPKNLELLETLGGVDGLMRGLGTHETLGLGKKALMRSETFKTREAEKDMLANRRPKAGAGYGASHPHDPEGKDSEVPGIVITPPEGKPKGGAESDDEGEGRAFAATLDERKRIYGPNLLPHRASKSLLQLMWTALKDKVLVSESQV
jgi:P-type Ca2+ transporter type 2C